MILISIVFIVFVVYRLGSLALACSVLAGALGGVVALRFVPDAEAQSMKAVIVGFVPLIFMMLAAIQFMALPRERNAVALMPHFTWILLCSEDVRRSNDRAAPKGLWLIFMLVLAIPLLISCIIVAAAGN